MRKLTNPNTGAFNAAKGACTRKKEANKMALVCAALLLVSAVIFLATSLSLTHGLMQCQQKAYPVYMETLVNYHVAFMVVLVAASIIFGGAAYSILRENGGQCDSGKPDGSDR